MISLEESIHIYARASRSWFAHNAASQAARRARQAHGAGDPEGREVWLRVKAEVERLDSIGFPRKSRP